MSEHIHKRHNKTLLLYHIVFPVKYRKRILTKEVSETLKSICIEISDKFEIKFLEIGSDINHIHFLIQSIPTLSIFKIVKTIKGITAREIFKTYPDIKKALWGGNLWTSGYYANTIGQYGNEKVISNYVKQQGHQYNRIHAVQLSLFDNL